MRSEGASGTGPSKQPRAGISAHSFCLLSHALWAWTCSVWCLQVWEGIFGMLCFARTYSMGTHL